MGFGPDITEIVARSRADLRMGVPLVLQNSAESAGLLVCAAETLNAARLSEMRALPGETVVAITRRRAETLKARAYDGDLARILLPADATWQWVQSIADPADDLETPMKGPLATQRADGAALCRRAISLCKASRLLPAAVCVEISDAAEFAKQHSLTRVFAEMMQELAPGSLNDIAAARLPLTVSKAGRLHVFRPDDGAEEHYAVEIGKPDRSKPVLARLHSACFTGDLLGSLKCDCGPQLRGALAAMGKEGQGVLLYLNQEGRGIGLANKMRAYALQDQGFDTIEANHRLGFEDDERDFRIGAEILKRMGFESVRLMTNNPAKIARMEGAGIRVTERVPLQVGKTPENTAYLATKAAKSGHLF